MLRRIFFRAEAAIPNISSTDLLKRLMTTTRHHNQYVDGAACFWTSSIVEFVPVTTGDALRQKLQYIRENPVRRGLVEHIEDWEFSSASWYTDGTDPLVIEAVEGW